MTIFITWYVKTRSTATVCGLTNQWNFKIQIKKRNQFLKLRRISRSSLKRSNPAMIVGELDRVVRKARFIWKKNNQALVLLNYRKIWLIWTITSFWLILVIDNDDPIARQLRGTLKPRKFFIREIRRQRLFGGGIIRNSS